MSEHQESDVRSLLKAGVGLEKLEQLYDADLVHKIAKSVIGENVEERGYLAPALMMRATSERLRSLLLDDLVLDEVAPALTEAEDEEFMDPLMLTVMKDPVVLSSGFVVDRATALDEDGRLRMIDCPFTRKRLAKDVYPLVPLKRKIKQHQLKRLDQCIEIAEKFVVAEQWDRAAQVIDIAEDIFDGVVDDSTYHHKAKRLAEIEKLMPNNALERILNIHRRLIRVAPPGEVGAQVEKYVNVSLEKSKRILEEEKDATKGREIARDCFEYLKSGKFLADNEGGLLELCRMILACSRTLGDEKDVWAQRRFLASNLGGEELAAWLQGEGITGNEKEMKAEIEIPLNRCFDVQWNPPGHPMLGCTCLRTPFTDEDRNRVDGFYTFVPNEGDNSTSFVRKKSNGSITTIFGTVEFLVISDDVLMVEGEGCFGTLIKGRNIPEGNAEGTWDTREVGNPDEAIEWLRANFG